MKNLESVSVTCHSFPELNGDPSCQSSNSAGIFKPLYRSSRQTLETAGNDDPQDTLDQIREKRFQQGFEAGCQDACRLCQQEIDPEIGAFASQCTQLSEYHNQVEANACNHISGMALRIAEKILGEPTHLTIDDLESFRVALKRQMSRLYQLHLSLNPEDKHILLNRMASEDPQWPQCSSIIHIDDDVSVESGSLRLERDPQPFILDDILAEALDSLLAEASTK